MPDIYKMVMLKRAVLLFAMVCFLGTAHAQLRLAPIAGFNFNRQIQKSNNNRFQGLFNTKLNFSAGVMGDILLTDYLSLQPELLYTFKGGSYTIEPSSVSEENTNTLGYISMPVCLTGKLNVKGGALFAGAGVYVSRITFTSFKLEQNAERVDAGKLRIGTDQFSDQITPWDYGFKFKAGFELQRGFYMTAFYDVGMKDINPQWVQTRNQTVGVQLGYILSLTEEDKYERFENFYEF